MFFIIFLLIWTGLHAYVVQRLLSIPFIVQHISPAVIVARGTCTWGPRMRLWQRSELLKIALRNQALSS